MSATRRSIGGASTLLLLSAMLVGVGGAAEAATLPAGFGEQIVFSGLNQPTNLEFAPDGRIFIAEKRGVIKVYDNLADTSATIFADLQQQVFNGWDRGLLGLALPPNFPTDPWVYVLYTYDAPPGQTAPFWNDDCNALTGGANGGSCVVTGRLSRLRIAGNTMTGSEEVLVHDWCQQYPSHSVGDLKFGADGKLYVSAGDGASFGTVDYGQLGTPPNPCNDPVDQGGALRSQDVRSTGDPTGLDGTVLRLEPSTGLAAAGNPKISSADLNTRRIVGYGLRNPFRFGIRPGTNEVWLGDVGWNKYEEINRLTNPTGSVPNFGWPCYEGTGRMASYDNANKPLCETLYSAGGHTAGYFTYAHANPVVAGESCGAGGDAAIGGIAFYPSSGGAYPAAYRGALFFADYSRKCIWAMHPATPGGLPSPTNITAFAQDVANPVDLAIGPGGDLYYVSPTGTVRRIRYFPANQPPAAVIGTNQVSGLAPLTVAFTATGSTDPDPADAGKLTYQWDFTNDGSWDSTAASASYTYTSNGTYTARLRVTDPLGATGEQTVTIHSGNRAPTAFIDTPLSSKTWQVGEKIFFTGHGTDPDQSVPSSALSWELRMRHCASAASCHTHVLSTFSGAGGSFTAPDHEFPSYLELALTVTDDKGLSHTVVRRLDPKTVLLYFDAALPGTVLSVGSFTGPTPFTREVIQGSSLLISAPLSQTIGGKAYLFLGWTDGGDRSHTIIAGPTSQLFTAKYRQVSPRKF